MPVGEGSIKRAAGKAEGERKKTVKAPAKTSGEKAKKPIEKKPSAGGDGRQETSPENGKTENAYEGYGIGQPLPTYLL